MNKLFNQKIIQAGELFAGRFMDMKTLYLYNFNALPSVNFISGLDGEKAFKTIEKKYAEHITNVYTYREYEHGRFGFNETVVVLNNRFLVEFDESYCHILHDNTNEMFLSELATDLLSCAGRQKKEPLEMNLIIRGEEGLKLKSMEIKRTELNLDLFYEDDFKEVDLLIKQRLNKEDDKGIVLLHGLPGTGKTTYLRHLISDITKRVLFLSPSVAGNLMNPEFLELLIENPNTVVVIEDAENIIMDRRTTQDSSVSNLLNISDGLLADFLNVQLICTFNSSLTMVDSALLRKGRLIAKYEFGKLSIGRSQKLSDYLGFKTVITKPMTVAEISNQTDKNFETNQVQVIGFRREHMSEN